MVLKRKEFYIRHLAAEVKKLRAKGEEINLPDSAHKLLLYGQPFQCRICFFACDKVPMLSSHITGQAHVENCKELLGPILCVRCSFMCNTNLQLIEHFDTDEHALKVDQSDRPCIIKESRTRVQCKYCVKIFRSATKLQLHIDSAHSGQNKPHQIQRGVRHRPVCPCCNKEWESASALEIHMARKRSDRQFHCMICKVAFITNHELSRHLLSEKHLDKAVQAGDSSHVRKVRVKPPDSGKGYLCKWDGCNFRADKRKELKLHYTQHSAEGLRFQCKLCIYSTSQKSHFDKHLTNKKHLRLAANAVSENGERVLEETNLNNVKNHISICDVCSLRFDNVDAFYEHRITHVALCESGLLKECDGDELKHCPEKYHDFVKQLSHDTKAKVQCPDCDKLAHRSEIVAHLRSHTNTRPYQCIYCSKSFAKGSSLRCHLINVHLGTKAHKCDFCEQRYPTKYQIQQHQISKHRDKINFRPEYVCEECGGEFMASFLFRQHLKNHNKAKPFRCPWKGCVKCFSTKAEMVVHVRWHTQEKPYLCDMCGFSAPTRSQMNRHKRIHTQERRYKCEYCTYSAITSSALSRHVRVHAGSKAYKCPHCSFQTADWGRLNKHVKTKLDHKGLYLYNCHLCMFKCAASIDFKDHLFGTHGLTVTRKEASALAGVYLKEADRVQIAEGQMVIPVQEKFDPIKCRNNVRW